MSVYAGDEYLSFCEGLRELSGIDLTQYKRPQMERRLRSFLERRGFGGLMDSLPQLRADKSELEALLDRMTINVSQLWRNPEHWSLLETKVLPELGEKGRVTAWSAGCSYGAEAYTLGAICRHVIPKANVSIRGTDIDKRMVERAKRGLFSAEDARSAPAAEMARFFERVDEGWQARQELRSIMRFEIGDLLRIRPQRAQFDLILCRNTVIYFAEPIRDELHARLAAALRPGGYLMVGATERVSDPKSMSLVPVHPFMFRKV